MIIYENHSLIHSFITAELIWNCWMVLDIVLILSFHHKKLYTQLLHFISKFCMLAFYYLENHISVRHFDHTIFEGVIVLFDLHYFIRMWVEGGGGGGSCSVENNSCGFWNCILNAWLICLKLGSRFTYHSCKYQNKNSEIAMVTGWWIITKYWIKICSVLLTICFANRWHEARKFYWI